MTSSRINSGFSRVVNLLILLAFAITACLPAHLYGQELSGVKGGLQGVVTDTAGAVVPGASVTVTGNADTRHLTTNDSAAIGKLSI